MRFVGALIVMAAIASCSARPAVCRLNSDCMHGYYCDGVSCTRDCAVDLDCPTGSHCNAVGRCDPGAGDGGAGDLAGADFAGADFAGALGNELDRCGSDSDCAPPLGCRAMVKSGVMRCTRACSAGASCPAGERCLDDGSGATWCLASDFGRDCNAGGDCNFACLTSLHYCTLLCADGNDCPNGWGCMPIGNPAQRVCVRAEAPCSASDTSQCIAPAACDTSASLVVAGCTTTCTSASDCPQRASGFAAWTCDGGGICRRPPDVYGPLGEAANPAQYACNAQSQVVNVCNDAQHIDFTQFTIPSPPQVTCGGTTTTAGVNGDACVDSCRYRGGCIYGAACVAVGNVGGARIGLCLLANGAGEVGAACATDGDCAFGYCIRAVGRCSRDCTLDGVCPTGSSCTAAGGPPVDGFPFKRCQ